MHRCLLHLLCKRACVSFISLTLQISYMCTQTGTTWTALYDFIETFDFYARMQDICIRGATDKCIKLCFALVNRCMGIQSDVHCF